MISLSHPRVSRAIVSALLFTSTACVRAPVPTTIAAPARAGADSDYLRSRNLVVPVRGVDASRLPDTYHAKRSGSRIHRATDIMAPRGTPVLSADDGRVISMRDNASGGLVVYAFDPAERLVYYYAHLDKYRDGLKAGARLAKGDVIGYVGTSGNAPKNAPHLHFQVMRHDPGKGYWDGTPLDARPFLTRDGKVR